MLVRSVGQNHAFPWNKDYWSRRKKPLQPKHVWSIRVRLEIARVWRDIALFNLAIDGKLRTDNLLFETLSVSELTTLVCFAYQLPTDRSAITR
jgi:hypothetical protein